MVGEWHGDNPYYLHASLIGGFEADIDLDEKDWTTKHADLLRGQGVWSLVSKEVGIAPVILVVREGEQPYYTARHFKVAYGGQGHVVAYGIGKKRLDGHVDRLWVLPNGIVCAGDDVDPLGNALLKAGGP